MASCPPNPWQALECQEWLDTLGMVTKLAVFEQNVDCRLIRRSIIKTVNIISRILTGTGLRRLCSIESLY